ncbi:MAG: ATPase domain-containing protein, partial [Deltaproteobacteria bacterium]|nr:ATPase domain-containing protein [Deltaproteobacteria bacterium]
KSRSITTFFTSLVSSSEKNDTSGEIGVSSLIDTWIVVRELEVERKRTRSLFIVKSRGTGHESDVHRMVLTDDGVNLEKFKPAQDTKQHSLRLAKGSGV